MLQENVLSIPWGASRPEARKVMLGTTGVSFLESRDDGSIGYQYYEGGRFENSRILRCQLLFIDDRFSESLVTIAGGLPDHQRMVESLSRKYGRPGHPESGGINTAEWKYKTGDGTYNTLVCNWAGGLVFVVDSNGKLTERRHEIENRQILKMMNAR